MIDLLSVDLDLLVVEGTQFFLVLEDLLVLICLLFLQGHTLLHLLSLLQYNLLLHPLHLFVLLQLVLVLLQVSILFHSHSILLLLLDALIRIISDLFLLLTLHLDLVSWLQNAIVDNSIVENPIWSCLQVY